MQAGRDLMEARRRIDAGEAKLSWAEFLSVHSDLSRPRAHELIQIAGGKTTVEATRERAGKGMAASRRRTRLRIVRNVTDAEDPSREQVRAQTAPREASAAGDASDAAGTPRVSRLEAALAAFDALTPEERALFLAARGLAGLGAGPTRPELHL